VILHEDLRAIEQARHLAAQWLATMGLELTPAKTRIGHTPLPVGGCVGFDFLGFEVRPYRVGYHRSGRLRSGFKTIIQPSKPAQQRHDAALANVVRRHCGVGQTPA
jgi:RNA-directed DNA polymerase